MTLTDWFPCTTPPVRDGWYDLQRKLTGGQQIAPVERVRFANGEWDWRASESKVSVWVGMDYWRGVTEGGRSMMICRQTMQVCQTPGMCSPHGGCRPDVQPVQMGWKCPVCGKGNAPFMPTCGNQLCGVDLSKGGA